LDAKSIMEIDPAGTSLDLLSFCVVGNLRSAIQDVNRG